MGRCGGKRLASYKMGVQHFKGLEITESRCCVAIVSTDARVGQVDDGKSAKPVPRCAGAFDQARDCPKCPDVQAAGLNRDQHRVGQHQRDPERFRISPANVNDDILELGRLLADLNAERSGMGNAEQARIGSRLASARTVAAMLAEPCGSPSTNQTSRPARARATASKKLSVVFPTPPFVFATARIIAISPLLNMASHGSRERGNRRMPPKRRFYTIDTMLGTLGNHLIPIGMGLRRCCDTGETPYFPGVLRLARVLASGQAAWAVSLAVTCERIADPDPTNAKAPREGGPGHLAGARRDDQ